MTDEQVAIPLVPEEIIPQVVEDDPKVPVKAVIAAVVTGATYLAGSGLHLPHWLEVTVGVIVAFGAVYYAKNPKRLKSRVVVRNKIREAEKRPGRHAR